MKLIIDIPEEIVTAIQNGQDYRYDIHTAIAQGKPYDASGDLISREALKNHIIEIFDEEVKHDKKWAMGLKYSLKLVDNAPAIEQEVYITGEDYDMYIRGYKQGKIDFERPQGEWINTSPYDDKGECSLCCYLSKKYYKFCPNCGAEMKGKEE